MAPLNTLVHDIAERSAAEVSRRVVAATAAMSAAELRGYVRARALGVVRSQTEQVLGELRIPNSHWNDLVDAALERTVHLVVRDLQLPPVIAIAAPHVRAAA